jgi:hypothetical protein
MKSPFFAYQLNCGSAHPIPAEGRESFVMEMTAAGLSAGVHNLDCTSIQTGHRVRKRGPASGWRRNTTSPSDSFVASPLAILADARLYEGLHPLADGPR